MKVFISWSGLRSKLVAELLNDWIKCVIQATRPWISTRDIDRGALWFNEISDQLKETRVGIICLTAENKNKPWILFEAGALAKGLSSNRVCTFLIDLKTSDIEDPLAQFNHTLPSQDGLHELVKTINNCLGDSSLDSRILDQIFTTYWPQFESSFREIIKTSASPEKAEPRSEKNLLSEILENTRYLTHRVRALESKVEESKSLHQTITEIDFNKTLIAGVNALKRSQNLKLSPIARLSTEEIQKLRDAIEKSKKENNLD
ncbi:toll/interleukin-1 receptor domain-containing protein [Geothrix paludis]|uniref:toll/interleukin-1 receptor domain-containing protein n=1 Tax=Geothrix paludis TaxID=2922722 RepID=UPI001FACD31B|nr:toll/interleukin-1 receptor domain-containing protein [Geothrix paludis]